MCPLRRSKSLRVWLVVSSLSVLLGAQAVWAQEALTARLLAQGGVSIMSGEKLLATLSLNAHGPEWKHVDQAAAAAVVRDADPGPGQVVEGTLAVPNTEGAAVQFAETVKPLAQGLSASYTLGFTRAVTLNGLQVSLLLPAETFAGKSIVVHTGAAEPAEGEAAAAQPLSVALPAEVDQEKWQLAAASASKIEIAAGTDDAITIIPKLPEAGEGEAVELPRFVIQDLRKWEQNVFEVRLVLIMADKGKQLAADQKMNVALDLLFARELQWR